MKWLARVKTPPVAEMDATKPTKPVQVGCEGGFVGFVAPALATIEKFAVVPDATVMPSGVGDGDPDCACWPHSAAMTGREIDTFTARLARFTDKGLRLTAAECWADKLVIRDREQDGRHSCLECASLTRSGGWRCGNWQRAGVAIRSRDAQLPSELVHQLQWCDGFTNEKFQQKQPQPGNVSMEWAWQNTS